VKIGKYIEASADKIENLGRPEVSHSICTLHNGEFSVVTATLLLREHKF